MVAQVYDRQHAALMESMALYLHTDAMPASIMPSSAGPSSAGCTIRSVASSTEQSVYTPVLLDLTVPYQASSQLEGSAPHKAVRPHKGLQADKWLSVLDSITLPEEVSMEPAQAQAFPLDSYCQRRVPQPAKLLCAAQPCALSNIVPHWTAATDPRWYTSQHLERELADSAKWQPSSRSARCAFKCIMGVTRTGGCVLEWSCGMPEQEQVCCRRSC